MTADRRTLGLRCRRPMQLARRRARRRARISAGRARRLENLLLKELFTLPKDLADRTGAMAKSRSLSWRLGVSTLVIVLPLVLFALIMVGWIAHDEREAERNRANWRRLRVR